jgi:hypothetical protein
MAIEKLQSAEFLLKRSCLRAKIKRKRPRLHLAGSSPRSTTMSNASAHSE